MWSRFVDPGDEIERGRPVQYEQDLKVEHEGVLLHIYIGLSLCHCERDGCSSRWAFAHFAVEEHSLEVRQETVVATVGSGHKLEGAYSTSQTRKSKTSGVLLHVYIDPLCANAIQWFSSWVCMRWEYFRTFGTRGLV